MLRRVIATIFLIFGLFGVYWFFKPTPKIILEVMPSSHPEDNVADDQFLLLLEKGHETDLDAVLKKFDLVVVAPLGEWLQVRRNQYKAAIVDINSPKAQSDLKLQEEMEKDNRIHSVHFNYQLIDQLSCAELLGEDHKSENPPNDRYFSSQWYLAKDDGIDLPGAWRITTGSEKTVIAVVDRHFDAKEFDLAPKNCASRKFVYENVEDYLPHSSKDIVKRGHGADVLSVLAPCTNNDVGLAAVDWHAQIIAVDSKEDASLAARMFGILWAIGADACSLGKGSACPLSSFPKNQPAKIINTSFGFANKELKNPPYGLVLDTIGQVNRRGGIIVASAGNEGGLADRRLPGAAGGVISVGSSNRKHQGSPFSNWGRTIDVLAPGEGILGLMDNELTSLNGTSFSAPLVSGVVALMASIVPKLSWKHAEYFLKSTATPLSCKEYCSKNLKCKKYCCKGEKNLCGSGIVNAKKALELASRGIPNLALIDVDDYYIPLKPFEKQIVTIKNWGKKAGLVSMKKTYEHMVITPETILVPPMDQEPGLAQVVLSYHESPKGPLVMSLILQAADADKPKVFHDQIEAIVEIIPDNNPRGAPRILKELEGLF